jgi:hypothetical protein
MGIVLTKAEKAFLAKYEISPQCVMDGTGLPRKKYAEVLRATGKLLAWGVTPCARQGHRIRNAHGKCVMCYPATLVFSRRHRAPGYVYVAHSPALRIIKIGLTSDNADRVSQLRMHNLGGVNDWKIHRTVFCEKAGEIELAVQQKLAKFQVDTPFSSKEGYCRETFNCGLRTATAALREALASGVNA